MPDRQQFNVTLPPELIRRIKYRAIDDQLSASHLVERLLTDQLELTDQPETTNQLDSGENFVTDLVLQPMVHVEDMPASVAFYEALGARVRHGSRDGDFVLLDFAGGTLSLLAHPANPDQHEGTVELNFDSAGDLTAVEATLRAAGVTIAQPVVDEGFGRQLQVSSPDGLLVKINELQPELYT